MSQNKQDETDPMAWFFSQPTNVKTINFSGNNRTNVGFLEREFSSVKAARTMREAHQAAGRCQAVLSSLDLYEDVRVEFDKAVGSAPDDLELAVTVKEKRSFAAQSNVTACPNGDGRQATGAFAVRNVFGNGERLTVQASHSDQGTGPSYFLTLTKPRLGGSPHALEANLFHQASVPSYTMQETGGSVGIRDKTGQHSLTFRGSWRDVTPGPVTKSYPGASAQLVQACGSSVKNSLMYTWQQDRRNDPRVPTRGSLLDFTAELAGLGGDVQFATASVLAQQHMALPANVLRGREASLSVSCLLGLTQPWHRLPGLRALATGTGAVRLEDRFFAGGSMLLRGFQVAGIGPRHGADPLGGTALALACTSLACQLPPILSLPARGQVFATAGNVAMCKPDVSATMRELKDGMRASVGAGLVLGALGARVELNASTPLNAQEEDLTSRLQFGFGVRFL